MYCGFENFQHSFMYDHSEVTHVSPANVTDGGVAVASTWVAALVHTNCERQVARQLEPLVDECYVPVQEEIRFWSDRKKKIQRIVIPNIVFVRCLPTLFVELKRLSYVRGLLVNPGEKTPAIISDGEIEKLRFMLGQSDVPVELDGHMRKTFLVGDKFRVVRGLFRGLEGDIYSVHDSEFYVGVLLHGIGFACVHINKSDIERI